VPIRSAKKKPHFFTVPLQDVILRVSAPEDYYEEARAAGMHFWEQVQAYGIRNPLFRTSKRRLFVTEDAPEPVKQMAADAAIAGVGPMYTFNGALVEYVGRQLSRSMNEVMVAVGGHYFVLARRRARLGIHTDPDAEDALAVIVKPELGAHGICSTVGRARRGAGRDGLVVVAHSAILADAAATAAQAMLSKADSFSAALGYLQGLEGVHGALVIRGEHIGFAGGLELAA